MTHSFPTRRSSDLRKNGVIERTESATQSSIGHGPIFNETYGSLYEGEVLERFAFDVRGIPKGPKCDSSCVEVNNGQTLFSGSSRPDCRVRRRRPLGPCSRGGVRCFSQHGGVACRSSKGTWQRCTQAEIGRASCRERVCQYV